MKKRLSVLLSIIIVLSICAPLTSVMAEEARKQSVLKTGKEIAALCSEYDNYNELDSTYEQTINTRLIVKSDDKIEEYDAIDSVYGFGYAFLQYADDESAEENPRTLPPNSSIAASKLNLVLVLGSKNSVANFLCLHTS